MKIRTSGSRRTRSVAVFKNGLGFFLREGDVKLRDGWCVAERVPPAAFGTLAIYARNEKEVVDVVGSGPGEVVEFDGRDAPKDPAAARRGWRPTRTSRSNCATSTRARSARPPASWSRSGRSTWCWKARATASPCRWRASRGCRCWSCPCGSTSPARTRGVRHCRRQYAGHGLLRKGITWIPDYTLKVLDDDTAELTLRGTMVNEAEDLIHTDVHLVVGRAALRPHRVHGAPGRGPGDPHDRRRDGLRECLPAVATPDDEPRGPGEQHRP